MAVEYLAAPKTTGLLTQWGAWENKGTRVEVLQHTGRERRVVLMDSLVWRDPDGQTIVVPEGYNSDGASIPYGVWWLMGGRLALEYIRAAFVHDISCVYKAQYPAMVGSEEEASVRFYPGLRADGMRFMKARLCYHGVSVFGPQWQTL